ncbi:MAG TPA: dihydrolipoamide acetyltransferase family protein [bacterium]|nr:dihydrolipoamide acetyltransferase family protein [bacterium]
MPVEVKMPQLGESTYEGTIGKWLKQPGEPVERFEPLVEIITDKVNVEMPAPFGGTLTEILVVEGTTVNVGTPIAMMETASGAAVTAAEVPSEKGQAAAAPTAGARAGGPPTRVASGPARQTADGEGERARLSPVVRRLAEEHGLALDEVAGLQGSGTGGRVTKDDVLKYLEQRKGVSARPAAMATVPPRAPAPPGTVVPAPSRPTPAPAAAPAGEGDELVKLTPLRRSIAQRMAQSKREIPHAYGVIEADITTLIRWREAHKEQWRAREGVNITLTAFFIKAAAEAIKVFPMANSVWTEDGILMRKAINIGVGIALDEGLIVAVVKHADQKSLVGVAKDLDGLGRRARDGKLTLDDVQRGTFTITNPGVFGSIWSMPIIVPGQAAILATDAAVKRPVVRGEGIAVRDIMHLGLSFDHRIFDGAVAVQFLNRMKAKLEGFPGGDAALTDF